MARHSIISISALGKELSLVPERYDPIRTSTAATGIRLSEIVQIISQTVVPSKLPENSYVTLDTTHAFAGVVNMAAYSADNASTQSNKKVAEVGDVIVSRLRPYLKQVAYLDGRILQQKASTILCSTEFFVLRSLDPKESIAYLVPFLLSTGAQTVLAASQEGGHHPRFNADTLANLCVPKALFDNRKSINESVLSAVEMYRDSESSIKESIANFNRVKK